MNKRSKYHSMLKLFDPKLVPIFTSHVKTDERTTSIAGNFRELDWFGYMSTPSPSKIQRLIMREEVASMLLSIRGRLRIGL
jgi:hypothetical protein